MNDQSLETFEQPIATPRTDAVTFDIEVIGDARTKRHNYTDGMGDFVNADFARTLERDLAQKEQEKEETKRAYQTVKDWAHRVEDELTTLLSRCDDHQDGSPDATALEKFCNEMIGISNSIRLGDIWTLKQQLQSLQSERDKLQQVLEQTTWSDEQFKNHLLVKQVKELKEERDKLRKALEEEVGRIEYGNSVKPGFYESNSHFDYCSNQSGDPRDCSVCGTFYLMKDALNHSKSTTQ